MTDGVAGLRALVAPVSDADRAHVIECLRPLNGDVDRIRSEIESMLPRYLEDPSVELLIVETSRGEAAGLVTLTRFAMPRYAGYGYEIEEIAMLPQFRGQGLGRKALLGLVERLREHKTARKIVVRTNGADAARLYASVYDETDMRSFQRFVNKI